MTQPRALEPTRALYLGEEHRYGSAETAPAVLQWAYCLHGGGDMPPAIALNGGVAWQGGVCDAVSGAAIAVGRLAKTRIAVHGEAKRIARKTVAELMTKMQSSRRWIVAV